MKRLKKIIISTLLACSLFTLTGCNKKETVNVKPAVKSEIDLNSTNFNSQVISIDDWSFEIPSNWEKLETEKEDADKAYCYAPKDLEAGSNTSNVNIVIRKSEDQPSINDIVENIDEAIVAKIVEVMPAATNFKYDDIVSKIGDILYIEYDVNNSGIDMHTNQYLILADDYSIAITSININDNTEPSPEDVAKHMVNTLKHNLK